MLENTLRGDFGGVRTLGTSCRTDDITNNWIIFEDGEDWNTWQQWIMQININITVRQTKSIFCMNSQCSEWVKLILQIGTCMLTYYGACTLP